MDMVNNPVHYADKKIEVIDYIRDTLTHEGFIEYCGGNVLKYVSRWRKKGGVEDLKKAQVYLGWMIDAASENSDFETDEPEISEPEKIKYNVCQIVYRDRPENKLHYGIRIENGDVIDAENGKVIRREDFLGESYYLLMEYWKWSDLRKPIFEKDRLIIWYREDVSDNMIRAKDEIHFDEQ